MRVSALATPVAKAAITAIHNRVQHTFDNAAHHVALQLRGLHVLGKAASDDEKAKAQAIVDQLNLFDLQDLKAISSTLSDVVTDAATTKLDGAGVEVSTGLFGQINHQSVSWASQHAADLVTQITDTTRDQLRATIAQGYADGLDVRQIADQIGASAAFSKSRSLLIANTETAIASGEGSMTGFRTAIDLGIKIQKQWLDDPEACPTCVGNAAAGPIDIEDEFPSGDLTVPAHPNCLPGYSFVTPCGGVSAATRRWFKGNMIVVGTSDDHFLTLTPNHPVLTDHGWVAAGLLNEGDRVIGGSLGKRMASADVNDDDVPTCIEEIVQTFSESIGVVSAEVIVAPPDFHSDGVGSDIAIIWTNRKLRCEDNAALEKHLPEGQLVGADVQLPIGNRDGAPDLLDLFHNSTASGDVGGSGLSLSVGLGVGDIPHDAGGLHTTDIDSGLGKDPSNGATRYVQILRDFVLRFATKVAANDFIDGHLEPSCHRIVSVTSFPFEGYVYNIETSSGFYIAQGLIVHNCSCDVASVIND